MDLRGHWSSVCPALLRYPRRNQVAPDFSAADELSHRWGTLALSRKREREASSFQPPYPSPPHFSLLISVRPLPPRSSPARSRPPCSCGETPPPPCIPRNRSRRRPARSSGTR